MRLKPCSICIAFSTSSTNFSTGYTNFRNIYAAVESHEISKVQASSNYSIEYLINRNVMNMKKNNSKKEFMYLFVMKIQRLILFNVYFHTYWKYKPKWIFVLQYFFVIIYTLTSVQ